MHILRSRLALGCVALSLAGLLTGCSREAASPKQATGPVQPLSICQGGILATLPFIAREQGFFAAEGLDVSISFIGDGKAAMDAFLAGKCEVSLSGEFPVARQSFDRTDLAVIATVATSDNAVKILARRDRGIAAPKDLAGKRVGVSMGTISSFFLDQFLKKNRIPRKELTIIDMSHRDLPDALQRGDLDAYAGTDIAFLKGNQLLGKSAITFTEPGLTRHAACLTVKKEWLATHQKAAQSLLRALVRAEEELARHPDEQTALLAKQLNTPLADLQSMLAEQHSVVTLDQVLLLALEDEARWMQETGIVKGKAFPNHLHLLESSILKAVNPDAVRLK